MTQPTSGQHFEDRLQKETITALLKASGEFENDGNEYKGAGAHILEFNAITGLADTNKSALLKDDDVTVGYALVLDASNGNVGTFELDGVNDSTTEIDDPSTSFSATEGTTTNTPVNVYWDATNSRFEVENQTGGSVDLYVLAVKLV